MNAPESFGTTVFRDFNPMLGGLAAYGFAIVFLVAIGWALFYWRRRRARIAERFKIRTV